jgi:hypothetical protein
MATKQVYFVIAVEIDENEKPTITFLDDDRAEAVFGTEDVWNETTEEWEGVGDDNDDLYLTARSHLNSLIN